MATGKPDDQRAGNRPPPDDSLWTEDPPLVPRQPAAVPAKPSSASKPASPPRRSSKPAWDNPTLDKDRLAELAAAEGTAPSLRASTVPSVTTISPKSSDEEDDNSLDILLGIVQNAPAWLISAVVHTSLLIVLGLCLAVSGHKTVEINQGINLSEPPADSLDDLGSSDMPRGTQTLEKNDSQVLTPRNMATGDVPFATPPAFSDIHLGGIMPVTNMHGPTIGLALQGREGGMKGVLLGVYGGTGSTESAVGRGLEWLAKQQRPDGLWSMSGPYSDHAVLENTPAATAMALLAFQGAGITPHKGKYAKAVDKGWTALLKLQQQDGSFTAGTAHHQGTYAHAQCTIALCEVLSMTHDSRFDGPAQQAVAFCIAAQDKRLGGWRYDYPPGQVPSDSDMSVTGWFVMALKSAQMAGIEVSQDVIYKVTQFLDADALVDGSGRYGYQIGTFSTPAVTAEAYLCRQLLGWKQDDQRLIKGCRLILASPVKYEGEPRDVYYWYYATQVCHHMEGEIWSTWNNVMREEVPAHQVTEGPEYGSWDPQGDRWGTSAGRLYETCLSIYMLEVYYRHLPLYSAYRYTGQ